MYDYVKDFYKAFGIEVGKVGDTQYKATLATAICNKKLTKLPKGVLYLSKKDIYTQAVTAAVSASDLSVQMLTTSSSLEAQMVTELTSADAVIIYATGDMIASLNSTLDALKYLSVKLGKFVLIIGTEEGFRYDAGGTYLTYGSVPEDFARVTEEISSYLAPVSATVESTPTGVIAADSTELKALQVELEKQISESTEALKTKEEEVEGLKSSLANKEAQITALQESMENKTAELEAQIQALTNELEQARSAQDVVEVPVAEEVVTEEVKVAELKIEETSYDETRELVQEEVETPVETPVEEVAQEAVAEVPVETPVQEEVEAVVEAPVEEPVQAVVEAPVEEEVAETIEEPVQEEVAQEAVAEVPTEEPVQEVPVETPVQEEVTAQEDSPTEEQAQVEEMTEDKIICPDDGVTLAYIREYAERGQYYQKSVDERYPDYEFYWILGDAQQRYYQYHISTHDLRLMALNQ